MSASFTLYAIRHRPTGAYLPMRWDKRRGYSHDEPQLGAVPRLLKSEQAAKAALRMWLQGVWTRYERYSFDGDFDEDLNVTPVEGRNADDMEIVRMRLVVDEAAPQ